MLPMALRGPKLQVILLFVLHMQDIGRAGLFFSAFIVSVILWDEFPMPE